MRTMSKIKVGIVGASGYAGEELVRLLSRHPNAELACVCSRSLAGTPLAEVMPQFRELIPAGLAFIQGDLRRADRRVVSRAPARRRRRIRAPARRRREARVRPFGGFSPERSRDLRGILRQAASGRRSAEEVALRRARARARRRVEKRRARRLPGLLPDEHSDSARAAPARRPAQARRGNVRHRLLLGRFRRGQKIRSRLRLLRARRVREGVRAAEAPPPFRNRGTAFARGGRARRRAVFAAPGADEARHFDDDLPFPRCARGATLEQLYACWEAAYAGKPFVAILKSGKFPDTAHVAGTNRADISAVLDPRTGNFVITSCIDNVVKGASGQAVQLMNLALGFPETAGLV